jgi:hypothetical protein
MRKLATCALLSIPAIASEDPEGYLSTIAFEPFSGTSVVSWVQPLPAASSGAGALFVKRPDSEDLVQQDRLTDDLVLCTARIEDGAAGRATVVRGTSQGEPPVLAAPDLSALELVLEGQNGETYVARILADASPEVIYAGHLRSTARYTTRFLHERDGELDDANAVLGVRAYVTCRAGTDAVELDLRIHNGAQRPDLSADCGKVYFTGLELRTGDWIVREGTARIAEGRNVFPQRAQLVRRYVLVPRGDGPYVRGFRTGWASAGASYFTRGCYGPDGTLVPRVDLGEVQHSGKDLAGNPVGPFRLIDVPNPDAPGGKWIFPFPGGRRGLDPRAASLAELERLADRVQERMPIAYFDAESGEPLTSRAFAHANGGKQPFQYDLQARHGIRRSDLPGQPRLPSGMLTGDMGLRKEATRSIHEGSCPYEAELERWQPYDGQHLIRGFTHAAALWSWTGDALSADWVRMVAADAGYDYTLEDVGGVDRPYRLRSLKTQLAEVEAAPGQGAYCEREWAWTSVVTSLACRIEPTEELKARCTGLLRFATTAAMPTGIPWRIRAPGGGGNVVYWTDYGTPEDVDACGTFQVPMIAFALSCLAEVEEDADLRATARAQIVRMAESVLDPERFTPSQYHAGEVGPPMSTWVARKGGEPFAAARGSGGSNPTNFPLLYALAAKASGDASWLQRIEDLGRPGPKDPTRMALSDTGFSEAFAALALAELR